MLRLAHPTSKYFLHVTFLNVVNMFDVFYRVTYKQIQISNYIVVLHCTLKFQINGRGVTNKRGGHFLKINKRGGHNKRGEGRKLLKLPSVLFIGFFHLNLTFG